VSCILLLLLPPYTTALHTLHTHPIPFTKGRVLSSTSRTALPKLKILKRKNPPSIHFAVLGPQLYLVPTAYVPFEPNDEHAVYESIYKYPAHIVNDTVFVVHISPNTTLHPFVYPGCTSSPYILNRYILNCTYAPIVSQVAEHEDVLWLAAYPRIQFSSIRTRGLLLPPLPRLGNHALGNGTGMRIVITDTGLDTSHCAFVDLKGTVPLGYIDENAHQKVLGILDIPGVTDFYANRGAHGTAVTGIAVGNPCFGESGVAPAAKVVFEDFSPAGVETIMIPKTTFYSTLEMLHRTYNVTVHSGSWGSIGHYGEYDDLCNIVDTLQYNNRRFVLVFSCGNDGPDKACVSPSTAKSVLSTGAILYDLTKQAYFSSNGRLADGRRAPLVTAPGWAVNAPFALDTLTDLDHADYAQVYGTSEAAPGIAGLVLVLQEYYTRVYGVLPSAALVTAIFLSHAIPPTEIVDIALSPLTGINITTFGTPLLLDPDRLYSIDDIVLVESENAETRQSRCFQLNQTQVTAYNLSVVWTDVPAFPGASQTLVNDIDVVVITDQGVWWSDDGVHPFETIQGIQAKTYARVVIFPYRNSTTLGPVTVALHVTFSVSSTIEETNICGSCLPGEFIPCPDGVSNMYCQDNGEYSNCLSSTVLNPPPDVVDNCTADHAMEAYRNNGTCQAWICAAGYALDATGNCTCIPNVYHGDCQGDGTRSFQGCTLNGSYGICSATGNNPEVWMKSEANHVSVYWVYWSMGILLYILW
jgi:hypothetical protein